jgi:hypothetical protein
LVLFEKTKAFLEAYEKNLGLELSKYYQALHDGCSTGNEDEESIDEYLWSTLFTEYYDEPPKSQYQQILKEELKELNEKGVYFLYCKFKIYEKTYEERLNKFLDTYEDAFPVHFLEDELKIFIKPINENTIYNRLDLKHKVDFRFTIDRCISYLVEEQARKIGYAITLERDIFNDIVSYKIEDAKNEKESISINEKATLQPLKWQGKPTELIELTKALIENETFKGQGTQKEIFIKIQNLFDIELKTIDKTINSFDEVRSGGNETKFLDALKVSLLNNINIKRKKRQNR